MITVSPIYRNFVWALLGIIILYTIPYEIATILACKPIRGIWEETNPPAQCIRFDILYYCSISLQMATDIILIILPLVLLRSLQVTKRKRVIIIILLGIGGLYVETHVSLDGMLS